MQDLTIPIFPVKEELLTPEEFLDLTVEERENIKDSDILAPEPGSMDKHNFGAIRVVWKDPIYKSPL